ncbi:Nn.00g107950.m01.CDS01 [Neocucurbitaria sp. VM-36]
MSTALLRCRSSSVQQPLRYQPLNTSNKEIRLLYPLSFPHYSIAALEAENIRDEVIVVPDLPMNFELKTVSLDSEPAYTALSYVWGNAATPSKITVNGCEFPVTENLWVALRHLQYKHIAPAIWIDAICIDQKNEDEKNYQVPLMGRIYSNARKVLVWLGPGTEDSDQAFMILHEFWLLLHERWGSRAREILRDHDLEHHSGDLRYSVSCDVLDLLSIAIKAVRARTPNFSRDFSNHADLAHWYASSFMAAEWWHRVWIIQEYVLAKTCLFQLGKRSIDEGCMRISRQLDTCIAYTNVLSKRSLSPHTQGDMRSSNVGLQHRSPTKLPLMMKAQCETLKRTQLFPLLIEAYCKPGVRIGCSDDRDRIFALSGLAEEDYKSLAIQTDYRKQSQEVFIDVAHRIVASGEMDILSLCRRPDNVSSDCLTKLRDPTHTRGNLPSWAPDWSREIGQPHFWFHAERNSLFSAAGTTTTKALLRDHETVENIQTGCPSSMILAGFIVDEVYRVGHTCYRGKSSESTGLEAVVDVSREIKGICEASRKLNHSIYTTSQLQEAVWRMPIWDHECRRDLGYQKATELSQARYGTFLHFGLSFEVSKKMVKLSEERAKFGIMKTLWLDIRLAWYGAMMCFHRIKFLIGPERSVHKLVQWFQVLVPLLLPFEQLRSLYDRLWEEAAVSATYYSRTMMVGFPTRLIMTKRGYIGFGPSETQPGDTVCIFLGSRVPHVLRKRDEGQPGYTLVGDAFIYGAMNGELMEEGIDQVDIELF